MEDNKPREVGLREARAELADLVTAAAVRGTITYLTNRGRRVAAVVPVPVAEAAERAVDLRTTYERLKTENPHAGDVAARISAASGRSTRRWVEGGETPQDNANEGLES